MSLSKTIKNDTICCLVIIQPRKTGNHPYMTEKLFTGIIKASTSNKNSPLVQHYGLYFIDMYIIQCVYVQEQRDHLRNLEIQKNELNNVLKSKRTELQRIRDETEAEDEVLQVCPKINTVKVLKFHDTFLFLFKIKC